MRTPLSPLRNPTISTGKSPLTREEREIVNPFLSCSTLQLSPLSNASERRISIFAESTIEGIPPPPLSPCSINNTEEYNCCEDEDFLTMESIFLK